MRGDADGVSREATEREDGGHHWRQQSNWFRRSAGLPRAGCKVGFVQTQAGFTGSGDPIHGEIPFGGVVGSRGIRVKAIYPGPVDTELRNHVGVPTRQFADFCEAVRLQNLMKRSATAAEIAWRSRFWLLVNPNS